MSDQFTCYLCKSFTCDFVHELFAHVNSDHFDNSFNFICGFDDCQKQLPSCFESLVPFKKHCYAVHKMANFDKQRLLSHLSGDSFFGLFCKTSALMDHRENSNIVQIDLSNSPLPSPYNDVDLSGNILNDTLIYKLGKIAFKCIYGKGASKSSLFDMFIDVTAFYNKFRPSIEQMDFINFTFANKYRVTKFFEKNFQILDYSTNIINQSEIYCLDLPCFFENLLNQSCMKDTIHFDKSKKNFMDGVMDGNWQKLGKNVIYLAVYVDDFNPLLNSFYYGPNNYKSTGIYLKIINLSPKLSSKRSIVCPFAVASISKGDSSHVYNFISDKINHFCSTFSYSSKDSDVILKFQPLVCCADNLAAHELLGLSTPACSNPCKHCLESTASIQENYVSQKEMERTPENMKISSKVFDTLKLDNRTLNHVDGVKSIPLLKIPGLDNPLNFPPCISHDLFEKIVPDVIFLILKRLDYDKLVNIESLIKSINCLHLSSKDNANPFKVDFKGFKGSAAQMRTMFKILLFAIHKDLPDDSNIVKGVYLLKDICDIIMSPFVYKPWVKTLRDLITQLLTFVRVDLDIQIYPKLHYLIHYPDMIYRFGPLIYFSTDIFESVHKRFKTHLISSCCHKNTLKTMFSGAIAYYSYKLLNLNDNFTMSSKFEIVDHNDMHFGVLSTLFPCDQDISLDFAKYHSQHIRKGSFFFHKKLAQYIFSNRYCKFIPIKAS